VHENEIRFKRRSDFPELRWIRATVDPNQHTTAKDLGCYCAIAISGYDNYANLYFLDFRGSREWDTRRFIDELFRLAKEYQDIPIMIEDKHMAHFAHAIRLEEERRAAETGERITLRIHWVPVPGDPKYIRWERLQPRFAAGRVFFSEEIALDLKREELVRGRASRFQDFLDVMAMAENGIRPKVNKEGILQEIRADGKKEPPKVTYADLIPELKGWVQ